MLIIRHLVISVPDTLATDYPALLCSGATSNAPVACFSELKDLSKNPALLCSPNGVLKGVTHNNIDQSYQLPYPFPFNNPYPFWFPFPDPNIDPSVNPNPPPQPNKALTEADILP